MMGLQPGAGKCLSLPLIPLFTGGLLVRRETCGRAADGHRVEGVEEPSWSPDEKKKTLYVRR